MFKHAPLSAGSTDWFSTNFILSKDGSCSCKACSYVSPRGEGILILLDHVHLAIVDEYWKDKKEKGLVKQ